MWETTLAGIVCVLFGVLAFFKPDWLWLISEKWKSYNADEPSDFYKASTKFGGVLFILMGIAVIIAPFIIK